MDPFSYVNKLVQLICGAWKSEGLWAIHITDVNAKILGSAADNNPTKSTCSASVRNRLKKWGGSGLLHDLFAALTADNEVV